ncbi:MAG TPA: hypothetical protein DCF68_09370, partial [Cyanothece sp. UBA12306]|nr:hypothetical protein [Cyanothece sp. UBA12306]
GNCLKTMEAHTNRVRSVAFRPDGKLLASGSDDQTIKLWDLKTSMPGTTFRAPRPYEGMKITGIKGLTQSQKSVLIALGAIE